MKHIAFFLSASDLSEAYTTPALELVKLVVERGYGFVYGGSERGLMKQAAQLVSSMSGKVIAVSSSEFEDVVNKKADEIIMGKDIGERKRLFLERGDAFIVLPGGTGTLDEITEIIEKKKLGLHNKPIAFLNIHGFWDGLMSQIDHMKQERFTPYSFDEMCFASDKAEVVMEYIEQELRVKSKNKD